MARRRRGWGSIRRLPSKRYQATYSGPDGQRYHAEATFETREDAEAWLAGRRREIAGGEWSAAALSMKGTTFGQYAGVWLQQRDLKPRTRELYRSLLDGRLLPSLGALPLRSVTPALVRRWYADQGTATPTARAHAYSLLRSIYSTAVTDELVMANPCRIVGAGRSKRVRQVNPASASELTALADAMPDRLRLFVLLAGWCGLRFGELVELRRSDFDLKGGVVHVRRAVGRVKGQKVVGTPKSSAGVRDVTLPPHLVPDVKCHLAQHAAWGRSGLVFPADNGENLAPSAVQRHYYKAREVIGRPDLRIHDLRHTQAVLAAEAGATLPELMHRLGHSTPAAAMVYQHMARGRDAEIATRLSALATVSAK